MTESLFLIHAAADLKTLFEVKLARVVSTTLIMWYPYSSVPTIQYTYQKEKQSILQRDD